MSKKSGRPGQPGSSSVAVLLQEGLRLHERGDYTKAVRAHQRVLDREPRHPLALQCMAVALLKLNQPQDSIPFSEKHRETQPDAPEPLRNLGHAKLALKRYDEAAAHFQAATEIQPNCADTWVNLGYAMGKAKRYRDAEAAFGRALALRPNQPDTFNHLGVVLRAQNRTDDAISCFLQAVALNPKLAAAWNNLGNSLKAVNRLNEALVAYREAIQLEPRNAAANLNYGIVRLMKGELCKEAWLKYEYRWVALNNNPHRNFKQPLWRGEEPLAGKSILLYAEQGLGDTLQFIRYAPVLAAQGAVVHLEVQPPLKALLTGMPGASSVIARGDPLPSFDLHCPLLSLPFALQTTLDTIPAGGAYVHAPADRVARWQERLPARRGLRIGVVWRGNPNHTNDSNRSMPFEQFRGLFDTRGCEFVALQLGLNQIEAGTFATHPACTDVTKEIADFSDTAAIVEQLDLVIAVDTSVAHLAGALGKPTWLLLPFVPDWRWLLEREDTPWYPSMRLFRQASVGEWDGVILRVAAALRELSVPLARCA